MKVDSADVKFTAWMEPLAVAHKQHSAFGLDTVGFAPGTAARPQAWLSLCADTIHAQVLAAAQAQGSLETPVPAPGGLK